MSKVEFEEWADKLANALGNLYIASMHTPANKEEQAEALARDAEVYKLLMEYRDWRNDQSRADDNGMALDPGMGYD